ncbi:hypothetical protein MUP01_09865 [Candidatus Bathyarchaeota archaeon]|nr:hypothetical protein [Candidatus Bathyarchaeota archaeon]
MFKTSIPFGAHAKGVEYLRGVYLASNLSIKPKTRMSKIDALKEIIRAWRLNPEEILTRQTLTEPRRTIIDRNQLEQSQLHQLSVALRALRTLLGYAASSSLMRHSFLSRRSVSSSFVISLRLRIPFILITMKALNSPNWLLGILPGPTVWKHPRTILSAMLKSVFLKRVSRVSCSSCPAGIHLLSLDASHKIRDPNRIN